MEDNKEFIDMALNLGVHRAKIIKTEDILFNPEFRKYCEENLCGFYNKNLMCPPDIGTVEEVINKAKSYKYGIFYQTIFPIEDFSDEEGILKAGIAQNKIAEEMKQSLKIMGIKDILCMSTRCKCCDRCAKLDNQPCHNPELAMGCLSAYCVDVSYLAKKCEMNYDCAEGTISHFGLTLFK